MILFLSEILSSMVQIILFSLLPAIWWCVTARKRQTFRQWTGLKWVEAEKLPATVWWAAGTTVAFMVLGGLILYMVRDTPSAVSQFAGLGVPAVPSVFVYALFHTALPEELLFRGFLLKRLAGKWGFPAANTAQAVLFGLLHGVLFFPLTGPVKAAFIILFTSAIAFAMGYINERKAGGSILPSWVIHALSNFLSGIWAAFFMI